MLMGMLILLLQVVVLCIVVYTILWGVSALGLQIPEKIVKLIWVAVVLVALIWFLPKLLGLAGVQIM